MSGRCRDHLYSRAMQHGSRGVCVRCGGHEPVRGIISGPEPRTDQVHAGPASAFRHAPGVSHVPQMLTELYPDGYDGA